MWIVALFCASCTHRTELKTAKSAGETFQTSFKADVQCTVGRNEYIYIIH